MSLNLFDWVHVLHLLAWQPDYEENLNPDGWQAADQLRKREEMDDEFGKIDNILQQFAVSRTFEWQDPATDNVLKHQQDVVVNDNATIFDQMLSAAPNLTVTFTYYALCSSKMDDFHQFLRVRLTSAPKFVSPNIVAGGPKTLKFYAENWKAKTLKSPLKIPLKNRAG